MIGEKEHGSKQKPEAPGSQEDVVMTSKPGFSTLAVHAGAQPDPTTGARVTPIYQTTAFVFENVAQSVAQYFACARFTLDAVLFDQLHRFLAFAFDVGKTCQMCKQLALRVVTFDFLL